MNKKTVSRRIFEAVNALIMIFVMIVTLYPLLYVLFASMSDANELLKNGGQLLYKPVGFTLAAYKMAFKDNYYGMY